MARVARDRVVDRATTHSSARRRAGGPAARPHPRPQLLERAEWRGFFERAGLRIDESSACSTTPARDRAVARPCRDADDDAARVRELLGDRDTGRLGWIMPTLVS